MAILTNGSGTALDKRRCILEIMVISHSDRPQVLPPVIITPTSGDEVFVGKHVCNEYPDTFSVDQYLVVDITPI